MKIIWNYDDIHNDILSIYVKKDCIGYFKLTDDDFRIIEYPTTRISMNHMSTFTFISITHYLSPEEIGSKYSSNAQCSRHSEQNPIGLHWSSLLSCISP